MTEIFGLPFRTFVLRLVQAIIFGAISFAVFFYVPQQLYSYFPSFAQSTGFSTENFLYVAVFVTILTGVSMVYGDHTFGDVAAIASGVTQIFYIYFITNGGVLSMTMGGNSISINFSSLLYLLITPSAIGIVATILRMASRSASRPVLDREEILLG